MWNLDTESIQELLFGQGFGDGAPLGLGLGPSAHLGTSLLGTSLLGTFLLGTSLLHVACCDLHVVKWDLHVVKWAFTKSERGGGRGRGEQVEEIGLGE